MKHAFPQTQRGVGLIEVLVAVAVLAFGLLGIAAMQITSLKNSQSSLERSEAVAQTYAILDAMRANRSVAIIGGYNINNACAPATATTLVGNDIAHWINAMQQPQSLGPTTCATIDCGSASCIISVSWDERRAVAGRADEASETTDRLTVETRTLL